MKMENGTQWVLFGFVCPTEELSENGLRYVKLALQLHEAFNFAQMLQGEILAQQWGLRENPGFGWNLDELQTYWHNYLQFQTNCTCTRLMPSVSFCKYLCKEGTWPRQVMREFCYWLSLIGVDRLERERRGLALASVFEGFQMDRKMWTAGRTQRCLHL